MMTTTFVTKCPCCGTRVSLELWSNTVPALLPPMIPTAAAAVPLTASAAPANNTIVFTVNSK